MLIVFVSLISLTLISFIFAFIQQAEAKRQVQISADWVKKVASIEGELKKCRLANQSPH
jgi:hypothetical protein